MTLQCLFSTENSKSSLAQHISHGALVPFILPTLLSTGGVAGILAKMEEPRKSDDPATIKTEDLPIACQLL